MGNPIEEGKWCKGEQLIGYNRGFNLCAIGYILYADCHIPTCSFLRASGQCVVKRYESMSNGKEKDMLLDQILNAPQKALLLLLKQ